MVDADLVALDHDDRGRVRRVNVAGPLTREKNRPVEVARRTRHCVTPIPLHTRLVRPSTEGRPMTVVDQRPQQQVAEGSGLLADLRPLKSAAAKLPSDHPIHLVLVNEPDEMAWEEYAAKATIWWRLLSAPVD